MAAEEFLETIVRTLPFAERTETIDDALVMHVTQTLRLSSAALFRATGDGFRRVCALGWSEPLLTALESGLVGIPLKALDARAFRDGSRSREIPRAE